MKHTWLSATHSPRRASSPWTKSGPVARIRGRSRHPERLVEPGRRLTPRRAHHGPIPPQTRCDASGLLHRGLTFPVQVTVRRDAFCIRRWRRAEPQDVAGELIEALRGVDEVVAGVRRALLVVQHEDRL